MFIKENTPCVEYGTILFKYNFKSFWKDLVLFMCVILLGISSKNVSPQAVVF